MRTISRQQVMSFFSENAFVYHAREVVLSNDARERFGREAVEYARKCGNLIETTEEGLPYSLDVLTFDGVLDAATYYNIEAAELMTYGGD